MNYLSNPYNEENNKAIFERVVLLTIVFVTIQLLLSLFEINITLGYFILPIIYVMIKYDRTKVDILEKFIPHALFTSTIILLGISNLKFIYELMNLLFLGGYIVAIYKNSNNKLSQQANYEILNFVGFFTFYIIAGSIVCVFYMLKDFLGGHSAIKSSFIFGGLDFFAILFSIVTLSVSRSKKVIQTNVKIQLQKVAELQVAEKLVSNVDTKCIVNYFEESNTYLETNFSLDQLAKDLNLSKQQVSETINQDMNSSFYQLVAMYRIDHAKKLIGKNRNLTIEAIVDECGFSSKSTFNKYFKYFVGQTPSVYRSAVA